MSSSESSPVRDLPMSGGEPSPVEHAPARTGESNPIRDAIAEAIAEHEVILFMKGTPEAPACGFSARTVAVLQALDDALRGRRRPARPAHPPGALGDLELADDPPAVRDGELIGGCDIVCEMYESGELAARRCCSVPRRMRSVAVATDSTHYLPRALADSEGIHQVSLYVGWKGRARARARDGRLRRLLRAPAQRSRTADHLPALDRRLPRRRGSR